MCGSSSEHCRTTSRGSRITCNTCHQQLAEIRGANIPTIGQRSASDWKQQAAEACIENARGRSGSNSCGGQDLLVAERDLCAIREEGLECPECGEGEVVSN